MSGPKHRARRPPETQLRRRLRDLAYRRRRFGYRRLYILLRNEGEASSVNCIYRLYRQDGLSVRRREARRHAAGMRAPFLVDARPKARWAIDFLHDQFAYGRKFRNLNIVDDVTHECLAAISETSISGQSLAGEFSTVIVQRGCPGMIVSDHGTEFTSRTMSALTEDHGIAWHFIAP